MEKKELTKNQKVKTRIWKMLYPFYHFPLVQKYILRMHWGWYKKGRQQYHLGWIAPGKTLKEVQDHLSNKWGFGNHFIAWIDKGQIVSWRKLVDFDYQYHIRIFEDGEIRGHYEYTPESKPFKHLFEVDEQRRTEDFDKFLEGFFVTEEHISHIEANPVFMAGKQLKIDTISI
jgi:hypothetical protein